jgi:hypothetical protein
VSWFVMAYSAAGRGSLSACTSPPSSVAPRPTLRRLRLGGRELRHRRLAARARARLDARRPGGHRWRPIVSPASAGVSCPARG